MKTFLSIALTVFVLPSYSQQPENSSERIQEAQIEVAFQLMGLPYSGSTGIDDLMDIISSNEMDMNLVYSNIYNASDSLKSLGDIGHMDSAIFTTVQHLDTCDWVISPIVSMLLFRNKQYNEAAFLLYVSNLRASYLSSIGAEFGGGQVMNMIFGLDYLPNVNWYLQTDSDNLLNVLNMVLDYGKTNDYPAYPRNENMEMYEEVLQKFSENISELEENKEKLTERWERNQLNSVKRINNEAKIASEKKKVSVTNASLIGSWTGPGTYSDDVVVYEFISDDSVYVKWHWSNRFEKKKCAINYGETPIKVEIFQTNTRTNEISSQEFMAEFLDENKLKFGESFSNNPTKFNPKHSFIITRKVAGDKSYYDYPKTERADSPQKSKRISNKELKRFWNDNIQNITDNETDKIITQIRFPLSGIKYDMLELPVDSIRFRSIESHDSPILNSEELKVGLKDLDYSYIEQIEMYNGEVILMIYMLGSPKYTIHEEDKAQYRQYGLLFKNDGGHWKLCYYNTGNLINGSPEKILGEQNFMMEYWSANFAKETMSHPSIQSMIDLDKEQIIAQTNFPLNGNWGEAIGLSGDSSDWTSEDLTTSLDVFFSSELRTALANSYPENMQKSYDETFTFHHQVSTEPLWIDKNWVYHNILNLKFGFVDNQWKLIQLDFEIN